MSLFEVQNLTYYYPESQLPALKDINLTLEEGEFVLAVGGSGSGKSSLAKILAGLIPDFYGGRISGKVLFNGNELKDVDRRSFCSSVGIVFQDPERQLVMTSVEAEIAFGLENLGLPQSRMFPQVAEAMSLLGLSSLRKEFTGNLSGGQKQKVVLAAQLAMQTRILVLDEPTSQLDPVAAEELLNLIERLNKEMGYTVFLIEQRLERCFHLADRLIVMDRGEIICDGTMEEAVRWQVANGYPFVPPVARLFALLGGKTIPLTIKDGRKELTKTLPPTLPPPILPTRHSSHSISRNVRPRPLLDRKRTGQEPPAALEAKGLWFTYPNGREALKGLNCRVDQGDFVAILGENAAGKTTFLKQMAGLLKPSRGKVLVMGKDTMTSRPADLARYTGYLSQNPNDYLFKDTVEEELRFTLQNFGLEDHGCIETLLEKLDLTGVRGVNPRDLSIGERQRVALASVLVAGPQLLLLDEPTRGIDYLLKTRLGTLLQGLNRRGMTVVMVTHDVEFAAEYARRVILMFDGRIANDGLARHVLPESLSFSPQIARLFRGRADGLLTVKDAVERMGGELFYACQPE